MVGAAGFEPAPPASRTHGKLSKLLIFLVSRSVSSRFVHDGFAHFVANSLRRSCGKPDHLEAPAGAAGHRDRREASQRNPRSRGRRGRHRDPLWPARPRTRPCRPAACTFSWKACASPAYLDARGTPETPNELTAHDHVGFRNPASGPILTWRCADPLRKDLARVAPKPKHICDDAYASAALIANGFGIGWGPAWRVSEGQLDKAALPRKFGGHRQDWTVG
ncbi:LysR substrate-binding domain-containing protein [Bradyrhizobium sp. STM 3809]|uniref:LysR substrate-binding domain-containing protein n=1 Tax=Bradyrhizobium sp. STM 3809 TaxID=551936 RepID=UPI001F0B375E|nr:LysR substrate-binding domain-containing protein [Bradyrhizobium sp. STM 3809]